jgi:hypothetical protein
MPGGMNCAAGIAWPCITRFTSASRSTAIDIARRTRTSFSGLCSSGLPSASVTSGDTSRLVSSAQ